MIDHSSVSWREADFRKSRFSGGQNGSCVEIARAKPWFGVRDSKNADGPVLVLSERQGHALLTLAKRGS